MNKFASDVNARALEKMSALMEKDAGVTDELYRLVMGTPWRSAGEPRNLEMLARYLGAGTGGVLGGLGAAATGGASLLPALATAAAGTFGGAGLGARASGFMKGGVDKLTELIGSLYRGGNALMGSAWRTPAKAADREMGARAMGALGGVVNAAATLPALGPIALTLPFAQPRFAGLVTALQDYAGSAIGKHIPVPKPSKVMAALSSGADDVAEGIGAAIDSGIDSAGSMSQKIIDAVGEPF